MKKYRIKQTVLAEQINNKSDFHHVEAFLNEHFKDIHSYRLEVDIYNEKSVIALYEDNTLVLRADWQSYIVVVNSSAVLMPQTHFDELYSECLLIER